MNNLIQNIKQEVLVTWNALEKGNGGDGIYTHTIIEGKNFQLCSAVELPFRRKFVAIGFKDLYISPKKQLPIGDGFEFKRLPISDNGSFGWVEIDFIQDSCSFYSLSLIEYVYSIIYKLLDSDNSSLIFSEVIHGVVEWQTYMQRIKRGRLSDEDEIGLWGELFLLNTFIDSGIESDKLLNCWQGPEKGPKDFVFPRLSVEVKTIIGKGSDFNVHIASLDQLDCSNCEKLFLTCVRGFVSTDGLSLPELIEKVRNKISTKPHVLSDFEMKLLKVGYSDTQASLYVKSFITNQQLVFPVDDSFPSLTTRNVPPSIVRVEYVVRLSETDANIISVNEMIDNYCKETFA